MSPAEGPPSCAPAPQLEGLGFADLNADAATKDDDCTELDCQDVDEDFHHDAQHQPSGAAVFDVPIVDPALGEARSDAEPLRGRRYTLQTPFANNEDDNHPLVHTSWRHKDDLRDFGNDFAQAASDREDTTNFVVNETQGARA